MPGTIGNTNSSKNNRLWADTIRRACVQADGAKLRAIAERLIEKAAEGDIQAIKELGDRLDGKAAQAVMLSGDPDNDTPIPLQQRPALSKDEWLALHGLGTAARPAK